MGRQDRRGCDYHAYVPDPLLGWQPLLPADIVADLADAESAARNLTAAGTRHVSLEGLARFLLRAESVGSSRIEGLDAGARRLLDAEVTMAESGSSRDQIAIEVLGNVEAMESAIQVGARAERVTIDDLLVIHRTLMERSPTPHLGGQVRTTQNWIGGSGHNPCSAAYVPPPPHDVPTLLDDLIIYVNGDDHSPLMQAALAHAQFESIHPFADGNGRTGRALIHVILRRRGLTHQFAPPISLILATWSQDYINALDRYCHIGAADDLARSTAAEPLLRTFAVATSRACADATSFATAMEELDRDWRDRLGSVRSGSAIALLLERLPGTPVVTITSAARLIGRSTERTGEAIRRLVEADVLRQRNVGRQRDRVFEAVDVVQLFTGLERALASPTGDTTSSPPVRPVPRRPAP